MLPGVDPSSVHPVPGAFVPVIKFDLHGVAVDLLLARLKMPQISRELSAEAPNLLLRCAEETDVHSINGARVAAAILRRVPHQQHFRATLRAVKLWARRRGIDQHASGYPGGVAWALLTAHPLGAKAADCAGQVAASAGVAAAAGATCGMPTVESKEYLRPRLGRR